MPGKTKPCQSCAAKAPELNNYQETDFEIFPDFEKYAQNKKLLYPPKLDLIHLVNLEYELKLEDGCIHACQERRAAENLQDGGVEDTLIKECCTFMKENYWILLEKFNQAGQDAATFYNTKSSQLVIVHRGTNNWPTFRADAEEVFAQVKGTFGNRAYAYTKRIVDLYGASAASITVTGHSLGGWLAQLAAFYMEHPNYRDQAMNDQGEISDDFTRAYFPMNNCTRLLADKIRHHLHCVSFDGPGCKEVIAKIFPRYPDDRKDLERKFQAVDVNVYLSPQNAVNLCGNQIGSVFRMECDSIFRDVKQPDEYSNQIIAKLVKVASTTKDVITLNILKKQWKKLKAKIGGSHSCAKILRFWQEFEEEEHVGTSTVKKVTDGVVGESAAHIIYKALRTEPSNLQGKTSHKFRTSCFNEIENSCINSLYKLKTEHYKDKRSTWIEKYGKYDPIAFLTSGYDPMFDFQLIELILDPKLETTLTGPRAEMYRDYCIRKMKAAVKSYRKLDIGFTIPDHFESLYTSHTIEYETTLPKLSDDACFELDFVRHAFEASGNRDIILIQTPPGASSTHVCTAKVSQILKRYGSIDPKQYFVLNSSFLSKLQEILECNTAVLPLLKYAVIECTSPYDAGLVRAWVDKLLSRTNEGRSLAIKIIIVFSFDPKLFSVPSAYRTSQPLKISEDTIKSLYEQADFKSLVQNMSIDFKMEGNRLRLTDLVPFSLESDDFYKSLEKIRAKLYPLLLQKTFGSLLPDLSSFEWYYQERTYQDVHVVEYSKHEPIVIVRGDNGESVNSCIKEFIGAQCEYPEMDEPPVSLTGHRFIVVREINKAWEKALRDGEVQGHIVKPKHFVSPDGTEVHRMIWKCSFGEPDMTKLKRADLGEFDCAELIPGSNNRLKIVADDPGMGKTTITKKLAIMSQELHGEDQLAPWTIFVDVTKVVSNLNKLCKSDMHLSSIVRMFAEIETGETFQGSEVFEIFLSHLIQQKGRVRIFFDGLDEINERLKNVVIKLSKALLSESQASIFIAGRVRLATGLENTFKVPCYKLNPLTHEQCIDMLVKYWTKDPEFCPSGIMKHELLRGYVDMFLKAFYVGVGSEVGRFLGVPFQLRMVADAYRKAFWDFYSTFFEHDELPPEDELHEKDVLPKFTNLIGLYQKFTWTKIREACESKLKGDINPETGNAYTVHKFDETELFLGHIIAGFDKVFCAKNRTEIVAWSPDFNLRQLPSPRKPIFNVYNDEEAVVQTQSEDNVENPMVVALHAIGIIKKYTPSAEEKQSDMSDFVHPTESEYLCAELIFHLLLNPSLAHEKEFMHFLNSYLFLPKYENVHYFLNMIIMNHKKNPPIFRVPGMFTNSAELMKYFEGKVEEVDCLGRNILHYVFMYSKFRLNEKCDSCHFIKSNCYLMKAKHLFNTKDSFGAKPLAYVFCNPKFVAIDVAKSGYTLVEEWKITLESLLKLAKPYNKASSGESREPRIDLNPYKAFACQCEHGGLEEFVDEHAKYLGDYSVQLRRNSSKFRKYFVERFLNDLPIEFALKLDGESRLNFVLEMHWIPYQKYIGVCYYNRFEECLFAFLQKYEYTHYKSATGYLSQSNEKRLLNLFFKNEKDKPKLERILYEAWEETSFSSIRGALQGAYKTHNPAALPRHAFDLVITQKHEVSSSLYKCAVVPWADQLCDDVLHERLGRVSTRVLLSSLWFIRHVLSDQAFSLFIKKYEDMIVRGLHSLLKEFLRYRWETLKTLEGLNSIEVGRELLTDKLKFASLRGHYLFERRGKSWESWEDFMADIRDHDQRYR